MSQLWCQNCIHCLEGLNPKYSHMHWYCDLKGYGEVWDKACDESEEGRKYAEFMNQNENDFYIDDGYLYFCAEREYDLPYRLDEERDNRPCIVFLRGALYGEDYDGYEGK